MEWLYFGSIILFVVVLFIFCKRPMYEVMFVTFICLCLFTGNIHNIFHYFKLTCSSYLPFTLTGFVVFAVIFERTGIINDIINIIVAIVGRFHGGAGYVALMATAAMGSFCGTGPGTAAATGTVTIPAMKKAGYSSELAAVVSAAGSTLGPTIPPSAAIPVMFMMLDAVCPGRYTAAQFWMFAWPISFWLIVQRFLTLFFAIRKENVQPVPKEERMTVKESLKTGWMSLLLPFVLFVPFLFAMMFQDTLITQRLGAEAASRSSDFMMCVVPSLAILITLILYAIKKRSFKTEEMMDFFGSSITSVAPIIITIFSGYCINELLQDMGITDNMVSSMMGLHPAKWVVLFIGPLLFTFMGMFIETSTLYLMFGPIFIPLAISVGVDPMIAAMSVNIMTNTMGQLTPPFALCLLVSIGIAESDFKKTCKKSIIWCVTQYIVIVMYLYGLLPMFGMNK